MDRWVDKVALVTGSNSGIGYEIAMAFVKNGLKVIGADINKDYMELMAAKLPDEQRKRFIPYHCDISKDKQVEDLFVFIEKTFNRIDVCVNNAGILSREPILKGTPDEWRKVLNVNLVALCLCSKLAVELMKRRNIDDGHIINVASMHSIRYVPVAQMHFYRTTKHAVKAATEGIRYELIEEKSNIRVSIICPGSTVTNILKNSSFGAEAEAELLDPNISILPEDIANSVLHVLTAPAHVQVQEIHVTRSGFPY